jgi:hypothetical protein
MTRYLANHQKKNRIFAKRERELVHAIKNGLPAKELAKRAGRARDAKISVFKCRFAKSTELQPHAFSIEDLAKKDEQVRKWLTASTSEIVEMYRR